MKMQHLKIPVYNTEPLFRRTLPILKDRLIALSSLRLLPTHAGYQLDLHACCNRRQSSRIHRTFGKGSMCSLSPSLRLSQHRFSASGMWHTAEDRPDQRKQQRAIRYLIRLLSNCEVVPDSFELVADGQGYGFVFNGNFVVPNQNLFNEAWAMFLLLNEDWKCSFETGDGRAYA